MNTKETTQWIVVTGATGAIGRWVVLELTRQGHPVWVLGRNMTKRLPALRQWVDQRAGQGQRVHGSDLDLDAPNLGSDPKTHHILKQARVIIHLAARFEFGLSMEKARRANVDATLELLKHCADNDNLTRFVHVSGYRAMGQSYEELGPETAWSSVYHHLGAYEASKLESHHRFMEHATNLNIPWSVICPSSVIGHSQTGETLQLTGIGQTMKDLYDGKLLAMPGTAATWCPVICADQLAQVIVASAHDDLCLSKVIVALDEHTPTLHQLIKEAAHHMNVPAPNRRVPIGLIAALPQRLTHVEPETLSFLSEDRYDLTSFHALCQRHHIDLGDINAHIKRWLDFLVSSCFLTLPNANHGQSTQRAGQKVGYRGDLLNSDVVLLHGALLDSHSWNPVMAHLDHQALALDLPGLGMSEMSQHTTHWVRDVLAQQDDPYLLVAHSLGCMFAIDYALAFPDRVKGLILVSPYFLQRRLPLFGCAFATRQLFRYLPPRRLYKGIPDVQDTHSYLHRNLNHPIRRINHARWLSLAIRKAKAYQQQLHQVTVPVTLVVGEDDPLVEDPPEHVTVRILKQQGHYPQLGAPAVLARLIDENHRQVQ